MGDDAYGYVCEPGEALIRSDEVACVLVYRGDRPIKIVYPDGRVEPFAGSAARSARDRRAHAAA